MEHWEIRTILLGYDGSDGAQRAADLAAALARQNNARIIVMTAFPHHSRSREFARGKPFLGRSDEEIGFELTAASETAHGLVEQYEAAGIAAEPDVLEGPASEAILGAAGAHNPDLIVVGRRGHGTTAELLLGSTSEYVVRRAKVPVLVAH
jgi:nucleotide-binding universal stress UspA family protein